MSQEIIQNNDSNEFIDPIGDLRRALNQEFITREQFNKWTNQLKNLPEFFEIAKKECK